MWQPWGPDPMAATFMGSVAYQARPGAAQLRRKSVEGPAPAGACAEALDPGETRLADRGHSTVELIRQRLGLAERHAFDRRESVASQARRREGGDLPRQLARDGQRLTGRNNAVDQPHLMRLRGGYRPARQDKVQRPPEPHDLRQPDGTAVDQRNAPAAAEHPE